MNATTPGPWVWDGNELFGEGGWQIVVSAGMDKAGGRFVRVSDADKPLIAAAPEMREALDIAATHLNSLNALVVRFLTGKLSEKDFVSGCIELSDGPERKACAAAMNAAMRKADGEPS